MSDISLCYATPSLGMHPSHTLDKKISAIASAGYSGLELGFDDLLSFAKSHLSSPDLSPEDYSSLCTAAGEVRRLCEAQDLTILVLQPFSNFEGYTGSRRAAVFEKAKGWKKIMDALGCEMIQVGSNDDPESASDYDVIAKDLAELADLMKPNKVAYENWCWGAHVRTWKDIWDVLKRANRENLGLCLDTFQSAGGEWGDPREVSGKVAGEGVDKSWKESMQELSKTVPKEKIFFFQISDALKPKTPFKGGYEQRGEWSHALRPPPYQGGYLPVEDMVRAVLETGFRGWFSMEVFLEEEHGKEWREGLGERWAADSMDSMKRLLRECGAMGESSHPIKGEPSLEDMAAATEPLTEEEAAAAKAATRTAPLALSERESATGSGGKQARHPPKGEPALEDVVALVEEQ